MTDQHHDGDLPPMKGSPFVTKNFNKFFYGIVIFAVVIAAVVLMFFMGIFRRHNVPEPEIKPRSQMMHPATAAPPPAMT